MTKLIALFILASACVSAQKANPPAADERWEYCIAQTGGGGKTATGTLEGHVVVFYATDQGRREETIALSEPMPQGILERNIESAGWLTGERALGKALAQLGKDRWELVSVQQLVPPTGYFVQRFLYFKRRAR